MTQRIPLAFCAILALALAMSCSTGGDVVKVTAVNGNALNGLEETDLATLEKIKQDTPGKGVDPAVTNVLEATPHFSVSEY
ncbi:MAG: hypothetical protein JRJ47_12405, partial [Deltaproteobacteria bacterium]|nr:hypothetical protein [Deltaproteobacteria bacterium]